MVHTYHKFPEIGPMEAPRVQRANRARAHDHAPVGDSAVGQLERNLPGRDLDIGDILNDRNSTGPTRAELADDIQAENLAANEPGASVERREMTPLTEALIVPELKHTRERTEKAGDSWYVKFAAGARQLSQAAGGLLNRVLSESSLAAGSKKFAQQLANEASEFINSGDTNKLNPPLTKEEANALIPASATRMAVESITEIISGAAEGAVMLPVEIYNRRDALTKLSRYVLGGGFIAKVYSGIRDRVTGKQAKDIEAILAGTTDQPKLEAPQRGWRDELSEGLAEAKKVYSGIRDRVTGKQAKDIEAILAGTTDQPKLEAPQRGWRDELREGLAEAKKDISKNSQEIYTFATSMPEALLEVGKFGYEGVVDLGRGYGQMFAWMREQYLAAAKTYERSKTRLNESGSVALAALRAGAERLRVAEIEANQITDEADLATGALAAQVHASREHYLKLIDTAERQLVNNHRKLNNQALSSKDRETIRTEMRILEDLLDEHDKVEADLNKLTRLEVQLANDPDKLLKAA